MAGLPGSLSMLRRSDQPRRLWLPETLREWLGPYPGHQELGFEVSYTSLQSLHLVVIHVQDGPSRRLQARGAKHGDCRKNTGNSVLDQDFLVIIVGKFKMGYV